MRSFFDRPKVIAAIGRKKAAVLSRGGALTRAEAQRSLKYEDGSSAPGLPPHAHRTIKISKTDRKTGKPRVTKTGAVRKYAVSPLREFLFFEYDFATESMVVGPKRLRTKIGDAPRALEHGGMSTVFTNEGRKTRNVRIRARPYMKPAGLKVLPQITPLWATLKS